MIQLAPRHTVPMRSNNRTPSPAMSRRRSQVSCGTLMVILAGVILTMTSCAQTGVALYEHARETNLAMKQELSELQLHIFDGEWTVGEYGDIPNGCGANGYNFYVQRGTPLESDWRMSAPTAQALADELMEWLDGRGWTRIVGRTDDAGVSSVTVEAQKRSSHIDDLFVTIASGVENDIVTIRATSTCEAGDRWELRELMFPDNLFDYDVVAREHPRAHPKFGMATPTPTATPES